ncbi:MAG: pyruvate, phosphate dikinase [bacterium]
MSKYVYFFGAGSADGRADMKNLLGGKGANLAEMTNLGIPVPAGCTISTEVCTAYYENNQQYPDGLWQELETNLARVEQVMGTEFGSGDNPLLVSVRSGARVSMPGMMDTVLNLGLNDRTVQGLIKQSGNERFAYDSYRRFVTMYGDVVLGVAHAKFEKILDAKKENRYARSDTDLDTDALKELVSEFKELVKVETGITFPEDPKEQLDKAIGAVFGSWNIDRAITYRKINNIPGDWGTAVNVQSMVYGNLGNDSGTGVAFTRDPSTGERVFFGEYLLNAQGQDEVAGIRTPQPINKQRCSDGAVSLEEEMPAVYNELESVYKSLENHYTDMQDLEFTIQKNRLFLLQTRTGKRTAAAAVKIAVDMVKEGMIDKKTAVSRVEPVQLDQLLHPMVDPKSSNTKLAKGLPASPGAAVGHVVFTAEKAESEAADGKKVILVRQETSPEDIGGMNAAQGILTARGGMTSHAAVVARGMGKCCVAGCGEINVNEEDRCFTVGDRVIREGDYITLNGSTGDILDGKAMLITPDLSGDFETLMEWVDGLRSLKVRTNADTPEDAKVARDFGAEGIGLCRTEHMFFGEERLPIVQQMILSDTTEERQAALDKLLPFQKEDFLGIFRAMKGLPVTIRLLDPPLHEFLPKEEDIERDTSLSSERKTQIKNKAESLHELNPMLGHRGCRLGISYPEIYQMQVKAIFEAACELSREGHTVVPEVMIPLVGTVKELQFTKSRVVKVAEEVMNKAGVKLDYQIGTMIEIPRAALTADEIAGEAEFFSFGTNDLTQMTFGYSRDDAGSFLGNYVDNGILPIDPFISIDQLGVGQLMKLAVEKGKNVRPDIKLGICGEHGGEPESVKFCHRIGLNYVSCSPYRVPIARLAAAQAFLEERT